MTAYSSLRWRHRYITFRRCPLVECGTGVVVVVLFGGGYCTPVVPPSPTTCGDVWLAAWNICRRFTITTCLLGIACSSILVTPYLLGERHGGCIHYPLPSTFRLCCYTRITQLATLPSPAAPSPGAPLPGERCVAVLHCRPPATYVSTRRFTAGPPPPTRQPASLATRLPTFPPANLPHLAFFELLTLNDNTLTLGVGRAAVITAGRLPNRLVWATCSRWPEC